MARKWYWVAILVDPNSKHFMRVHINQCPEEEARQLAERQNLLFAENYEREPYVLKSIEKVR